MYRRRQIFEGLKSEGESPLPVGQQIIDWQASATASRRSLSLPFSPYLPVFKSDSIRLGFAERKPNRATVNFPSEIYMVRK